jgi:hypothetical protein
MNKNECLNKYCELIETANQKEAKLEVFVQDWLGGNSALSSESMEQTITNVNDQIAKLRSEAKYYEMELNRISKEEQLEQEHLESIESAKIRLRDMLGVDTSDVVITDGVLSSNASESHLIVREKTKEEIELEKQKALATIREKVAKKEITLSQASQLKNDLENSFGINNEMSSDRHM